MEVAAEAARLAAEQRLAVDAAAQSWAERAARTTGGTAPSAAAQSDLPWILISAAPSVTAHGSQDAYWQALTAAAARAPPPAPSVAAASGPSASTTPAAVPGGACSPGVARAGPPPLASQMPKAGAWTPYPAAAFFSPGQGGGAFSGPPAPAIAPSQVVALAPAAPALAFGLPWAPAPQCLSFPKWGGSPHTKAYYLARLRAYKENSFFAPIRDWHDSHHPDWKKQSRLLYVEMMRDGLLPREIVDVFTGKDAFTANGAGMVAELLGLLEPTTPATMLEVVDAV